MEYTTYAEVLQESLKSLEKIDEMVLATEERLSNQKRNLEQLVSNIISTHATNEGSDCEKRII